MADPVVADLSNYTANLIREVADPASPTANGFGALTDDDLVGHLADASWDCRLDGLLQGYTCDEDGIITQISSTNAPPSNITALTSNPQLQNWSADGQWREMVQLIILYASFRILRNSLRNLRTAFAAAAGPVRYEYQQSAIMLTEIMKDVVNRRNVVLARLSDLGTTTVTVIDSIMARDDSLMSGATYWVTSGDMLPSSYVYGFSQAT